MAAKCNSRSDKRKIILQPGQTQWEKLFHCLTQTAHSLQESEMHFVQKIICLLKSSNRVWKGQRSFGLLQPEREAIYILGNLSG